MDIIILVISLLLMIQGKLAWVLLSLIALTTSYLEAGSNMATFPVNHNVSDSGLILYLSLFIYLLKKNNWKLIKTSLINYVSVLYIFLLVAIFFDLFINDIDLGSIVKTSRHWLFLSCVWIFFYIPTNEIEKLIKYLLNLTALITVIMLIEFFTGIQILGREAMIETSKTGSSFTRASIPSTFTLFFMFLLFSDYFKITKKAKYIYIALFSAIIITSMIRTMFIATVIGMLMLVWLKGKGKEKIRSLIGTTFAVAILFVVALSNPVINERFTSGFNEVQTFDTNKEVEGNFSFRLLQMDERVQYLIKSPQYSIFGIGNIIEEKFPDIFQIGLKDENGRATQLNTGDIAWSLLFLRLGFFGTFIYLLFYIKFLRLTFNLRRRSLIGATTFLFLFINLTMLSFSSSTIAIGTFWLFPVLLYYAISKKTSNEN